MHGSAIHQLDTISVTNTMSSSKELKRDHQTAFRPIGEAAAATDALKGDDDDEQRALQKKQQAAGDQEMQVDGGNSAQQGDEDDGESLEHPVEEIESLCMQCGENVSCQAMPIEKVR